MPLGDPPAYQRPRWDAHDTVENGESASPSQPPRGPRLVEGKLPAALRNGSNLVFTSQQLLARVQRSAEPGPAYLSYFLGQQSWQMSHQMPSGRGLCQYHRWEHRSHRSQGLRATSIPGLGRPYLTATDVVRGLSRVRMIPAKIRTFRGLPPASRTPNQVLRHLSLSPACFLALFEPDGR